MSSSEWGQGMLLNIPRCTGQHSNPRSTSRVSAVQRLKNSACEGQVSSQCWLLDPISEFSLLFLVLSGTWMQDSFSSLISGAPIPRGALPHCEEEKASLRKDESPTSPTSGHMKGSHTTKSPGSPRGLGSSVSECAVPQDVTLWADPTHGGHVTPVYSAHGIPP